MTDRRRDERVPATVPVRFNGAIVGSTRDVSPSGVYMVVDRKVALGESIQFALEMDSFREPQCFCCEGVVVRVEGAHRGHGVAVSLQSSRLVPRDQCRC